MIAAFYSLFRDEPLLVLGFLVALLVFAGAFAIRARVKITHRHAMDDREPEPLRRVVLDATARFPPKVQDRLRIVRGGE